MFEDMILPTPLQLRHRSSFFHNMAVLLKMRLACPGQVFVYTIFLPLPQNNVFARVSLHKRVFVLNFVGTCQTVFLQFSSAGDHYFASSVHPTDRTANANGEVRNPRPLMRSYTRARAPLCLQHVLVASHRGGPCGTATCKRARNLPSRYNLLRAIHMISGLVRQLATCPGAPKERRASEGNSSEDSFVFKHQEGEAWNSKRRK